MSTKLCDGDIVIYSSPIYDDPLMHQYVTNNLNLGTIYNVHKVYHSENGDVVELYQLPGKEFNANLFTSMRGIEGLRAAFCLGVNEACKTKTPKELAKEMWSKIKAARNWYADNKESK